MQDVKNICIYDMSPTKLDRRICGIGDCDGVTFTGLMNVVFHFGLIVLISIASICFYLTSWCFHLVALFIWFDMLFICSRLASFSSTCFKLRHCGTLGSPLFQVVSRIEFVILVCPHGSIRLQFGKANRMQINDGALSPQPPNA
jgi:hypothetical protein